MDAKKRARNDLGKANKQKQKNNTTKYQNNTKKYQYKNQNEYIKPRPVKRIINLHNCTPISFNVLFIAHPETDIVSL